MDAAQLTVDQVVGDQRGVRGVVPDGGHDGFGE
jgi:hypothetical protein